MIVYHYDPKTHVYQFFSSEADESPLEPGVWLIPANATDQVPPHVPNGRTQQCVFSDGAWHIEPKPVVPIINANIAGAPEGGLFHKMSIREALKGGVS